SCGRLTVRRQRLDAVDPQPRSRNHDVYELHRVFRGRGSDARWRGGEEWHDVVLQRHQQGFRRHRPWLHRSGQLTRPTAWIAADWNHDGAKCPAHAADRNVASADGEYLTEPHHEHDVAAHLILAVHERVAPALLAAGDREPEVGIHR